MPHRDPKWYRLRAVNSTVDQSALPVRSASPLRSLQRCDQLGRVVFQYLDVFLDQGFDSWDTILDIQESDL